ncbi:MAG: DUF1659 domain-containing protein [Caldicoprobacterales bacterium]
MALVLNSLDSRLQIQFHLGVNEEGREITRTKSFNRIRSEAGDEDLYEVAAALAGLQQHTVVAIRRNSNVEYGEE